MKKVLVVIDMQKDFVDGALGTSEAVAIIDNVIEKIETPKIITSKIGITIFENFSTPLSTPQ